jgi:hypothetical protein
MFSGALVSRKRSLDVCYNPGAAWIGPDQDGRMTWIWYPAPSA